MENLAEIYFALGDYGQAIDFYEQLVSLEGDVSYYAARQGIAYILNNELQDGISRLRTIKPAGSDRFLTEALIMYGEGLYHQKTGELSKALEYYNSGLKLAQKLNFTDYLIKFRTQTADIYRQQNKAIEALNQLEFIKKSEDSIAILPALKLYSSVYEQLGNYERSYQVLRKYTNLSERYFSRENMRQTAVLKTAYISNNRQKKYERQLLIAVQWITYDLLATDVNIEMKQPLNQLIMNLNNLMLKTENSTACSLNSELTMISHELTRLVDMHNFLDKLKLDKVDISPAKPAGLHQVVNSVIKPLLPYIEMHKIKLNYLQTELEDDFEVNSRLLKLILITLLDFSFKAIDKCRSGAREFTFSAGRLNQTEAYIKISYYSSELSDFIEKCGADKTFGEDEVLELSDCRISFDIFKYLLTLANGRYFHGKKKNTTILEVIIPGEIK
jgi:tetratricopeptide (TPR) repeat protein